VRAVVVRARVRVNCECQRPRWEWSWCIKGTGRRSASSKQGCPANMEGRHAKMQRHTHQARPPALFLALDTRRRRLPGKLSPRPAATAAATARQRYRSLLVATLNRPAEQSLQRGRSTRPSASCTFPLRTLQVVARPRLQALNASAPAWLAVQVPVPVPVPVPARPGRGRGERHMILPAGPCLSRTCAERG
jgi:hypothetical protein